MKASEVREVADYFIDALQSNERIKDKLRGWDYADGYSEGFKAGRQVQPKPKLEDVDTRVKFTDGGYTTLDCQDKSMSNVIRAIEDTLFNLDDDDGIELGDQVVHNISGFKGRVTGICDYIDTDEQIQVTAHVGKDNAMSEQWFTINSISKVK